MPETPKVPSVQTRTPKAGPAAFGPSLPTERRLAVVGAAVESARSHRLRSCSTHRRYLLAVQCFGGACRSRRSLRL